MKVDIYIVCNSLFTHVPSACRNSSTTPLQRAMMASSMLPPSRADVFFPNTISSIAGSEGSADALNIAHQEQFLRQQQQLLAYQNNLRNAKRQEYFQKEETSRQEHVLAQAALPTFFSKNEFYKQHTLQQDFFNKSRASNDNSQQSSLPFLSRDVVKPVLQPGFVEDDHDRVMASLDAVECAGMLPVRR